jgi:hypothetical protein
MSPGRGGGPTTHKRRTIGKDLPEREELQKTSVAADGASSSKLHYEAFSTSVAGRRKVQRQICHLVKTQAGHKKT